MKTITRRSTCGTLRLPYKLACIFCKPSILKAETSGKTPRRIAKCMRPFDEKWKDHRLHDKVDSYHSTIEFLKDVSTNLDEDIFCEVNAENNFMVGIILY